MVGVATVTAAARLDLKGEKRHQSIQWKGLCESKLQLSLEPNLYHLGLKQKEELFKVKIVRLQVNPNALGWVVEKSERPLKQSRST